MVKITIIMPVYNDEDYLNQSIDSVINQSLDDIELICINDGSTDNSVNILNDYSKQYDFIRVINQENQGPAVGRNKAIKQALGEYIGFLDSDDYYIDEKALEEMYNIAIQNNANMVSANIKSLSRKGVLFTNDNLEEFKEKGVISPEDYGIPYTFGKNIYNKKFLHDNNFLFPDYVRGEDPVFLAKILTTVDKIFVLPIDLMAIRAHSYSALFKIDTYEKKKGYIEHFRDTFNILKDANFNKMHDLYKNKIFDFIKFSRHFADNQLYDVVHEVFKDDLDILAELDKCFTFEKPKISIIIPFSNSEDLLNETFHNIFSQVFHDFEVLFVNCNSNDDSLRIIEDIAGKDVRFEIIDDGLKNEALTKANGDFLFFYQPGDKLKPTTLKKLYSNAINNDSDIVMFKIADVLNNNRIGYLNDQSNLKKLIKKVDFNNHNFNYKKIKMHVLNSSFSTWSKLYNKNFLDENNIDFLESNSFDNILFHVKVMLKANNISFVPEYLYYHRFYLDDKIENFNYNEIFKMCDFVEEYLKSTTHYYEFIDEFKAFKITQILKNISKSNSEQYYIFAKETLAKVHLENNKLLNKYDLKRYNYLLKSKSYVKYRVFDYEQFVRFLENENKKLNTDIIYLPDENKKLKLKIKESKKLNKELSCSRSWNVTKPLRKIKRSLK